MMFESLGEHVFVYKPLAISLQPLARRPKGEVFELFIGGAAFA